MVLMNLNVDRWTEKDQVHRRQLKVTSRLVSGSLIAGALCASDTIDARYQIFVKKTFWRSNLR